MTLVLVSYVLEAWSITLRSYLDLQNGQNMDPILPILSIWGYRAITLGSTKEFASSIYML